MSTLRIAICGSGMRSRSVWQQLVADTAGLELVGIQDPSPESLARALDSGNVTEDLTFASLETMLAEQQPDAVIVAPVNAAHAVAAKSALESGCHVLVEKPLATTLADAASLVETARERGLQLGAVQNWRTKSVGVALRRAVAQGAVGPVSHVFFRYLRDRELPHLPDYLFDEEDPLLFAMAIHHFDLFRYALDDEIVLVDARAARPSWSRYRHPSILQAWLETATGTVIAYSATFSSRHAQLPLESLQIEGELGTLHNESAYSEPPLLLLQRDAEPVDLTADAPVRDSAGQYTLADRAILENFRDAVVDGAALIASGADNLHTLAVVEAVARSWRERKSFDPRQLLESHA